MVLKLSEKALQLKKKSSRNKEKLIIKTQNKYYHENIYKKYREFCE